MGTKTDKRWWGVNKSNRHTAYAEILARDPMITEKSYDIKGKHP